MTLTKRKSEKEMRRQGVRNKQLKQENKDFKTILLEESR